MQWKTIKEFENYAVSNQGQIVKLPKRKLIAFSKQDIRVHKGKCPICTNTVNRSSKSL